METPSLESKETRSGETDSEKIRKLFREMPSDKIELLANHLARPDGFAKTLITGCIASAQELRIKVGDEFIKTHRGHYMMYPPSARYIDPNDYISFNVGVPQRLYQESSTRRLWGDWKKGLGFAISAKKLLSQKNVGPSWGMFRLHKAANILKNTVASEPEFEKYYNLSRDEALNIDQHPPKADFLTLVNMARKADLLNGGDQAEINMREESGKLPRLSLDHGIILIPQKAEKAFRRYLDIKIKDLKSYEDELKNAFGIDVSGLDSEKLLGRYNNIYWYSQENIDLAVEYLTTHPEIIHAIGQKN